HGTSSPSTLRPPTSTLFPYTTLFRSVHHVQHHAPRHAQQRGLGQRRAVRAREHAREDLVLGEEAREERDAGDGQRRDPHQVERRSEEHTSELQSRENLVCRLLLEKKN